MIDHNQPTWTCLAAWCAAARFLHTPTAAPTALISHASCPSWALPLASFPASAHSRSAKSPLPCCHQDRHIASQAPPLIWIGAVDTQALYAAPRSFQYIIIIINRLTAARSHHHPLPVPAARWLLSRCSSAAHPRCCPLCRHDPAARRSPCLHYHHHHHQHQQIILLLILPKPPPLPACIAPPPPTLSAIISVLCRACAARPMRQGSSLMYAPPNHLIYITMEAAIRDPIQSLDPMYVPVPSVRGQALMQTAADKRAAGPCVKAPPSQGVGPQGPRPLAPPPPRYQRLFTGVGRPPGGASGQGLSPLVKNRCLRTYGTESVEARFEYRQ
jgi:hypothetical protein